MAKYYVRCGSLDLLIAAEDPRGAALWTLHQFMTRRISLEEFSLDDIGLDDIAAGTGLATTDAAQISAAASELHDTLNVSEIGFGGDDAGCLETPELLAEWNQLLRAMHRLLSECGGESIA